MEIENLFRYTALAVGLKPSANQGKARLRGLYRIIYSKTIISVTVWGAQFPRLSCLSQAALCRARSVDRNAFRSPCGARNSHEYSTLSIRFNLCENCYNPVCTASRRGEPLG